VVCGWIKRNFIKKDFGLFLVIGGINTVTGTVFAFLFSLCLQPNIAFIAWYITALTFAYLLNSFFVFKTELGFVKFFKFAISYIPNFIIQNVTVLVVFNLLGLHQFVAYLLAAIIGVPVTFLILKGFAFNRKNTGGVSK